MHFEGIRGRRIVLIGAILYGAPSVFCQEKKLTVDGRLYTGFYSSTITNGTARGASFVPFGGDFNVSGYVLNPALLSFDAQPQFTTGPESGEAGFTGGNGITAGLVLLKERSFPLRLRFKDLRREEVFYGSLNQLSGIRSMTRDREFGVNWLYSAARQPQVTVDWGIARVGSVPDVADIPDYASRSGHRNIGVKDRRGGWDLEGFARKDSLDSSFLRQAERVGDRFELTQQTEQNQGSASRELGSSGRVSFEAGILNLSTAYFDQPFRQEGKYAHGGLGLGRGRKLETNFRGGYTSSLLSSQIQKTIAGVGTSGPGTFGPDTLVIEALNTQISNFTGSAAARYELHPDWGLFGSLTENRATYSGVLRSRDANFTTGIGGLKYQHHYAWADLAGQFSRTEGAIFFAGASGRIRGNNYSAMVQRGGSGGPDVSASFTGTDQVMTGVDLVNNSSRAVEGSLGYRFDRLRLKVKGSGGFERSRYTSTNSDFHSQGMRYGLTVEHARVQASYAHHTADGNSLFSFLSGIAGDPVTSPLLTGLPLHLLLTQQTSDTLLAHANPWRRSEATVVWTRGRQNFDGRPTNDFEQLEFTAGYRFRLLTFETGYTSYSQSLLGSHPFERSRIFFRLIRPFRVL